jgi:hypothetical protein
MRPAQWRQASEAARGPIGEPFHEGVLCPRVVQRERALRAAAVAVATLVAGRRIEVGFEPGESWAQPQRGRVNLDVDALRRLAPDVAAEAIFGIAAHEAAHVRWSAPPTKARGRLLLWLVNLIEDERIEREVVRSFPSLAAALERLRQELLAPAPLPPGELPALFCLVRLPERLTPFLWARHERLLRFACEQLDPFPSSPRGVELAARRILAQLPKRVREQPIPEALVLRCANHATHGWGRHASDFSREEIARILAAGLRLERHASELESYPPLVWSEAQPHPARYAQLRAELRRESGRFAAGLRQLLPMPPGERTRRGRLDRRRLWAHRSDPLLFRTPGPPRGRLELALVLDLSGSMRDAERLAQRIAVIVAEGASQVPGVRLHVYGHGADGDGPCTQVVRFTPAGGGVPGLGRLPQLASNRDAHAFDAIAGDLLRRTGPKHAPRSALFVLDGKPNARGFCGPAAFAATRRSLDRFGRVWGNPAFVALGDSFGWPQLTKGPFLTLDEERPAANLVELLRLSLAGR